MEKKTLLFHHGALGDVLLAFAALQGIAAPPAFDIYCQGSFAGLLQKLSLVNIVFPLEEGTASTLFSGSAEPAIARRLSSYDAIVLFSSSDALAHTVQAAASGPVIAVRPRPTPFVRLHVTDFLRYQLRRAFTCLPAAPAPPRPIFPSCRRSKAIFIHPGSGSPRKNWPLDRFLVISDALQRMGFSPEWILGPAEIALYTQLVSRGAPPSRIHRVAELLDVLSLLERACAFVGNDSGLAHLAAFCGLPVVAIFGPSDPVQWRPIGRHAAIVTPRHPCDPCFLLKKENCPEQHCLNSIPPEPVIQAIASVLTHARIASP